MAYNRINFYRKVIDIQDIVLKNSKRGVTQKWIYENIVYPQYRISRATYYNYLGINAKAKLRKVNEIINQPTLFESV
ncbi:MAG: hypothetical protein IMY73_02265 [Bacteroidetes bacterium]|nr:hypothetical protein [Bacteroidota bacterium]